MLSKETLENIKQQRIDVDGNIGSEMATELLALREKLEVLKQREPAGLDVDDIIEFERKAFWRGFESARSTENSNIPADWEDSKTNLLLALIAKISGD
ncbi:hypothetical protein [Yersinia massiliensis]|uniref:hypothetical protein n=1 Tax=Yersinia massiliensis TaxID=419257 RepID=UPI00030E0DA4|nr:hypothetical protein [Yersinia massiliensis]